MKTIILDTECNGMRDEAICQLSAIVVDDGYYTGINRWFAVHQMNDYAVRIHGLSKLRLHELSGGVTFEDWAMNNIDLILGADIYAGHNVSQDMHVVRKNLARIGIEFKPAKTFCTMKYFDAALHLKSKSGKTKPPRLDELCAYYRISEDNIIKQCQIVFGEGRYHAHDARYDTAATLLCILEAQRRGDVKGVIE